MADAKISALTPAASLAGTEVLPIVQSGSTKKVATDDLTVKNIRSNSATGILQVTGPGAGATRTMTVPNANFTAARTDAAQTFSGTQTFNNYVYINSTTVDPDWNAQLVLFGNATYDAKMVLRANGGYRWSTRILDVGGGSNGEYAIRYEEGSLDALKIDRIGNTTFNGGNVTASAGNFVIGTAGKGIDFSAASHAAGMTSELLDDYEVGTFTPGASSASGTLTVVDAAGRGAYVKIGKMVYFQLSFGFTTDASVGTSDITITGLPFASSSAYHLAMFNFSNVTAGDYGTGGASGHVFLTGTSVYHIVRTVDISGRGSAGYWGYAGVYSVD